MLQLGSPAALRSEINQGLSSNLLTSASLRFCLSRVLGASSAKGTNARGAQHTRRVMKKENTPEKGEGKLSDGNGNEEGLFRQNKRKEKWRQMESNEDGIRQGVGPPVPLPRLRCVVLMPSIKRAPGHKW